VYRNIVFILLALGVPATAPGSDYTGKDVVATATPVPPVIDGRLDDVAWADVPVIDDFHLVEPVEFGVPSDQTLVRVLYDADHLYIAARLEYSDPSQLVADILGPRQRVWSDDRFMLVLDPFLDRRNGYYFEINANAVLADALIENNSQLLNEWDGIWHAETQIDEGGWTAEIRIPVSTLSFNPGQSTWGINFLRNMRVSREFSAWSSTGKQDFQAAPSLAGTLSGLSGLQKGLGLDVIPTATLVESRDYETGEHSIRFEPSLDVTYRITPSLTAKLTLNTDFSATEVDDRQINLTRFSLFFPEKREFFLQDAGIFEFARLRGNGRPFFSRTIGLTEDGKALNLEKGAKITGRVKGWNLGLLAVQQEGYEQLGRQDLIVGRASVNVLSESSIGALVTHGDPQSEREALTMGLDFRYRTQLGNGYVLQGEAWVQETDNEIIDPALEGADASAWGLHARIPDDRHFMDARFYRFGAGFDPAMGFVNRPGITEQFYLYRFRERPERGYFATHDTQIEYYRAESLVNDELTEKLEWAIWEMESRNSDEFKLYVERERERLEEGFDLFGRIPVAPGDYAYTRYGLSFETARYRQFAADLRVELGDFLDGTRQVLAFGPRWTPSRHFNMRLEFSSNDVRLPGGSFTARLFAVSGEWAINNRLSIVPNVQFDNVSEELGVNLRVRWQPQRGQDLLFVWNRNFLRELDDRFRPSFQESVIKGVYTFRF